MTNIPFIKITQLPNAIPIGITPSNGWPYT